MGLYLARIDIRGCVRSVLAHRDHGEGGEEVGQHGAREDAWRRREYTYVFALRR